MLAAMRHRPKTWALITWGFSLVVIGAAVLLATFGAHPAVFVVLALWLLTLGLPTTIAFVLALGLWSGKTPTLGVAPDVLFVVVTAAAALVLQLGAYVLSARFAHRRRNARCS